MSILDKVEQFLTDRGFLDARGKVEHITPKHGTCCTCQDCGYHYDDCVCEVNENWDAWQAFKRSL